MGYQSCVFVAVLHVNDIFSSGLPVFLICAEHRTYIRRTSPATSTLAVQTALHYCTVGSSTFVNFTIESIVWNKKSYAWRKKEVHLLKAMNDTARMKVVKSLELPVSRTDVKVYK